MLKFYLSALNCVLSFVQSLKGHVKNCSAISMGVNLGLVGQDELILPDHLESDHGNIQFITTLSCLNVCLDLFCYS